MRYEAYMCVVARRPLENPPFAPNSLLEPTLPHQDPHFPHSNLCHCCAQTIFFLSTTICHYQNQILLEGCFNVQRFSSQSYKLRACKENTLDLSNVWIPLYSFSNTFKLANFTTHRKYLYLVKEFTINFVQVIP